MHSELKQISTLEKLFDLQHKSSFIETEEEKVRVDWPEDYCSGVTNYRSRYALLNKNIIVISSSGLPSPYDIRQATDHLEQIHIDYGIVDARVIWDVRAIQNPGIKTRKALVQCNKRLSQYWRERYLIVNPKYKTLIRIYKFICQSRVEHLYFAESIEDALKKIRSDSPGEQSPDYVVDKQIGDEESLRLKSKEELIEIIVGYKKNHAQSADKIIEAIGQISWEGQFKQIDLEVSEDDPHFELINAFSFLQQDVAEIIKEFKELNQNLELKVAERIVDFIDKESNLRAILDNSDRVTWLMNTRFELIDFNVAFSNEVKRRYNVTPGIDQNVLDLIPNEKERGIWRDRFESALRGKPGIYLDQDRLDDRERVWEIKTFPIKEIGKIKGVSVFIEDITPLKDSQFKLIEKNRDLQKVNNELDSFVYRVSHDLRAPLTSILGLISLMKLETDPKKLSEYIHLQEKSILKLDLFIKEIINLSRNSRLGITVSRIDFRELLGEIFDGQNFTKSAHKIERIFDIEDNLEFYTDRQRLSIILNNLISNSFKYANFNQKEPFIKLKIYSAGETCIMEVSDNGIGISEILLPKVFEMFFRATQELAGSGLGLYIVKETVEKLRGTIKANSKLRQGSVFKVTLPNLKDRFDAAPKIEGRH